MTKEECWNKNVAGWKLSMTEKGRANALNAMDEWAKLKCWGFAHFLQLNYTPHTSLGYWYDHPNHHEPISTEELYQLYIKQSQ